MITKTRVLQELQAALMVRAVGHTYNMLHGVKNADRAAVIVHNSSYAREIQKECPKAKVVSVDNIESLRGSRLPVSIDNFALLYIISNALSYIYTLEAKVEALGGELPTE